jgi:hypothetical protein
VRKFGIRHSLPTLFLMVIAFIFVLQNHVAFFDGRTANAQTFCGPMDVVFIIDDTGSMGGALGNVKTEIENLIADIDTASDGDFQLGLLTFKDNVVVVDDLAAANAATVQADIMALVASGGNYSPEASDEAINTAVNGLDVADRPAGKQTGDFEGIWRPGAVKIVILVTDALPAGFDDNYTVGVDDVNAHSRALEAAGAGILISAVFVPTAGANPTIEAIMQDYATTTDGVYSESAPDGTGTADAIKDILARCGSSACLVQGDKTASPATVSQNDKVLVTLTLSATCDESTSDAATQVVISDTISSSFELVAGSASGPVAPTVKGKTLVWKMSTLPTGLTSFSYKVKAVKCGTKLVNDSAVATYINSNNKPSELIFPNPRVTVECEQDLYIRDNAVDNGSVPSSVPWWRSPDICVRHKQDVSPYGVCHSQAPQKGQENYIYVKVHNRLSQPVEDVVVNLYYANAAMGLTFPGDWNLVPGVADIGDVASGTSSGWVGLKWNVPNLEGHFCLRAHVNAPKDPLGSEWEVPWNNNIAQRNFFIVEYPEVSACGFTSTQTETEKSSFDVINTSDYARLVDIVIESSDFPTVGTLLLDPGSLTWSSLENVWELAGGLQVHGFPARIVGISMAAHERQAMAATITAPIDQRFGIEFSEMIGGETVGGVGYYRYMPYCGYLPMALKHR